MLPNKILIHWHLPQRINLFGHKIQRSIFFVHFFVLSEFFVVEKKLCRRVEGFSVTWQVSFWCEDCFRGIFGSPWNNSFILPYIPYIFIRIPKSFNSCILLLFKSLHPALFEGFEEFLNLETFPFGGDESSFWLITLERMWIDYLWE